MEEDSTTTVDAIITGNRPTRSGTTSSGTSAASTSGTVPQTTIDGTSLSTTSENRPEVQCSPINDINAVTNSSDVSEGAAVHVICHPPSSLVTTPGSGENQDVFICTRAQWTPSTPKCSTNTATTTTTPDTSTTRTSTTSSTLSSSTVPVIVIQPEQYLCPSINDTNAQVNSTDVTEGTVVRVTCRPPSRLVNPYKGQDVYTCMGGHWRPLSPACSVDGSSSVPVGIIVGCVIGGVICLILVAIGLFMLYRSIKESRDQRTRNKEYEAKMEQIGSYINTSFQDSVGMPVLTMDTRDPVLRGRVSQPSSSPSTATAETDPDALKLGADLF